MRVDGSGLRQLTPWGQCQSIGSQGANVLPPVHLVRSDGGQSHEVYGGNANAAGARPVFSPDGTKILFACRPS
ncbi:MAG TPA: hypothetical protein VFA66_06980 [Gaiellaceae bacterium]|nr:hypothetical protein [Gaiellaceae bacterium]